MRKNRQDHTRKFHMEPVESRSICHIDSGSEPDTRRQDAVSEKSLELTEEQWRWTKEQYEAGAQGRANAEHMAMMVAGAQVDTMRLQNEISRDYWNYSKETFRPLEQGIVKDAQEYDTAERREAEAARGVADVETQISGARDAQNRASMRRGVNPNSGNATAMNNQMSMASASAKAAAAGAGRDKVETQGFARRMDAASLGRGLPSAQATAASLGINAGNAAAGTAASIPQMNYQGIGVMGGQAANTMSGFGQVGNQYASTAQQRQQAGSDNAGLYAALGSAAMYAFLSDKDSKEGRKPVKPEESLKAVRDMPEAEAWKYKKDSPGNDGGKTHVGPMAQDVQKHMGDTTAPGGEVIDMVSMNGHLMNAVKAIDKRLAKMEKTK
jgi:hypothetical protein